MCNKRKDKKAKMKKPQSDRICRNDFIDYLGKRFLVNNIPL